MSDPKFPTASWLMPASPPAVPAPATVHLRQRVMPQRVGLLVPMHGGIRTSHGILPASLIHAAARRDGVFATHKTVSAIPRHVPVSRPLRSTHHRFEWAALCDLPGKPKTWVTFWTDHTIHRMSSSRLMHQMATGHIHRCGIEL